MGEQGSGQGRRPRVLVVIAHPDDAEFICGGLLARWSREGYAISYCLCTDGNHGSSDPEMTPERLATIRREEQREAARAFGSTELHFLGYNDSELEPSIALRRDITRIIRKTRPHIVVCQDPATFWFGSGYINHPDHRAAAEAALGAIMPSSDTRMIFPELLAEGYEPHKVCEVYLIGTNSPNIWVPLAAEDIDLKLQALKAHKSQLGSGGFEERVRQRAAAGGEEARKQGVDCEFAEGFRRVELRSLDEALEAETGLPS
jgi:LmbE family N-acetylglucosaminyl deacetylase